jgi:hypothetical protein
LIDITNISALDFVFSVSISVNYKKTIRGWEVHYQKQFGALGLIKYLNSNYHGTVEIFQASQLA